MENLIKNLFGYIVISIELFILEFIILKMIAFAIDFSKFIEETFFNAEKQKIGF